MCPWMPTKILIIWSRSAAVELCRKRLAMTTNGGLKDVGVALAERYRVVTILDCPKANRVISIWRVESLGPDHRSRQLGFLPLLPIEREVFRRVDWLALRRRHTWRDYEVQRHIGALPIAERLTDVALHKQGCLLRIGQRQGPLKPAVDFDLFEREVLRLTDH